VSVIWKRRQVASSTIGYTRPNWAGQTMYLNDRPRKVLNSRLLVRHRGATAHTVLWSSVMVTAVVLVLGTLWTAEAGQWVPGLVHLHTTFSDGYYKPGELAAEARRRGLQFMVVADHYDMIANEVKWTTALSAYLLEGGSLTQAVLRGGDWGYDDYVNTILALNEDGQFVALPGAEIGSKWEPEPGNEASSHTLAIGALAGEDDHLRVYCEQKDTQQKIIERIASLGMLPLAAHPSLLERSARPKRIDYRYDIRPADQAPGGVPQYGGLAGVEFWNTKADQVQENLDFYLRLLREQGKAIVTSGSDFHYPQEPRAEERLRRITFVYVDDLTPDRLMHAFREGRTCATQYGVRCVTMSPLPGEHVSMDRPMFTVAIDFDHAPTQEKKLIVYRDGDTYPVDTVDGTREGNGFRFQWTDNIASAGEHSYVLQVSEVLISSPIFLNAQESPSSFRVVCTNPPDGATNVPIDEDMWFRFSEPVDIRSFIVPEHFDEVFSGSQVKANWLNIIVEPTPTIRSYGGPVFAQYDPRDDTTAAWFMVCWEPNTSYTVRLKTGIKSEKGTPLAGDYVFHFTTGNWRKREATTEQIAEILGPTNRLEEAVVGFPSVEQRLGLDKSLRPAHPTNLFRCRDWVWVYLHFANLTEEKHKVELLWYDPKGNIYHKQEQIVDVTEDSGIMKSCEVSFWIWPSILGHPPGKYNIEIMWDGKVVRTLQFECRAVE